MTVYIWSDKDLLDFQCDNWLVIPAFVMLGEKEMRKLATLFETSFLLQGGSTQTKKIFKRVYNMK